MTEGIMRAVPVALDGPIWKCPELWIHPDWVDHVPGWSWKLDMPNPLEDDGPWRFGLDVFLGHHIAYQSPDGPVVWRIVGLNESRTNLLCKWPD
ncbi:hypothetical protein [Mycobacterium sp. TY815]|uniref:hypothetical protein n=1 Tax=Mycobacterium sp. TY815 TaxID=3050581 RepID=UPI0027424CDD|nr:hypothetical protein [Mycobacterium sp. TY815]MDP7703247.1 hypothetical protein [Mycobacterium sp. TY815]